LSEGDEDLGDHSQSEAAARCPAVCGREAFLLRRAQDKRSFRDAAASLEGRRPRLKRDDREASGAEQEQPFVGDELVIAGMIGPSAAHSLVRHGLLAELRHPSIEDAVPQVSATLAALPLAAAERDAKHDATEARTTAIGTTPYAAPRGDSDAAVELLAAGVGEGTQEVQEGVEARRSFDSEEIASFAAEAEAELLRAERLEALRAEVVGVLSPPGSGETCGPMTPARKEVVEAIAHKTHRSEGAAADCGKDRIPSEAWRLDDMRREALNDLCGQIVRQDGVLDAIRRGGGGHDAAVAEPADWPRWLGDRHGAAGA